MPELIPHSPDNPEFARVIELRQLRDLDEFAFDIAPAATEAPALARLLGARAVRRLRLRGRLTPLPRGGWKLDGRLGATVVQTCVLTLDPVTTRIDQPLRRTWLPPAATAPIDIDLADDDEIEPLGERIDLGLVAVEALALALPPYPRKPGAALAVATAAGGGVTPLDEGEVMPFAALAALRRKMDNGS